MPGVGSDEEYDDGKRKKKGKRKRNRKRKKRKGKTGLLGEDDEEDGDEADEGDEETSGVDGGAEKGKDKRRRRRARGEVVWPRTDDKVLKSIRDQAEGAKWVTQIVPHADYFEHDLDETLTEAESHDAMADWNQINDIKEDHEGAPS
mmetsp:Transcript_88690/g.253464  ORF Transcript_88690/g.253464 Transcript_88690/m.253464 type:complete len:147 (+) Transcript_88690:35-475(+)